jgi:hypothetical protein
VKNQTWDVWILFEERKPRVTETGGKADPDYAKVFMRLGLNGQDGQDLQD